MFEPSYGIEKMTRYHRETIKVNREARIRYPWAILIALLTLSSCVTHNTSILGGTSMGGLVENSLTEEMDTISGATQPAVSAGVHTEWAIGKNYIESGLDYSGFSQAVNYQIHSLDVVGSRDISFHQLRIPFTYNLHLFTNNQGQPKLIIKGGVSGGYTFWKSIKDSGTLEEYHFTSTDMGPTFGIVLYPFPKVNNTPVGLYLDFYRGSRIYSDSYHREEGLGGMSYMKMGVTVSLGGNSSEQN